MRKARGRKMIATAQSRSARQAKERIMPKKPRLEPKVDEPKKPYEATPAEKEAVRRILARREGRSSAPNVSIRHEGETDVISLTQGDPVAGSVVVMDALGICEADFASWYLSQIIEVAKPGARADEKATNAMLAGIAAMRPRDEAEAMLIAQMIATHELAMTFARRLKRIENIPQQDSAVNGLTKLTRTYAAQMEALKRYRSGGEQKMTVQHVHVAEGGQAIVGNVNASAPGGGAIGKTKEQPHALGYAPGVEMPRQVEKERVPVPSSSDLPDARGWRRCSQGQQERP